MEGLHEVANFNAKDLLMRKILGLLLLISAMAMSQEMDSLAVDTIKKAPAYFGGVYLEMGGMAAPNPPGVSLTQFLGAGIQYDRWSAGFLVYNFKGTTQRLLIFPNVFELEYRYGGPFVSFNSTPSKWIDMVIQGSFTAGDMIWRNTEKQEDFLRDEFIISTIFLKMETGRLRFLRPFIKMGYQHMTGLSLRDLDNSDFSGFFFGVGVRVGYFNQ